MTIYTITVINQRQGWVSLIETHSNAQQAEDRLDRLEQIWNKEERRGTYFIEMHTTILKQNNNQ